jgi:uncharacterized protein YlxW (UPF0749 family)
MEEDKWNVEKEERMGKMQMAQQEAQRKQQEKNQLQQMISSTDDMLASVTVEKDNALQ